MGFQVSTAVETQANDAKRAPHPIIDRLLGALRYDKTSDTWSFTQSLSTFATEIGAVAEQTELYGLLTDLARLGYFLEVRRRSAEAAQAVVELLQALLPHLSLELFEGGPDRWRQAHSRMQRELAASARPDNSPKRPNESGVGLRKRRRKSK